MLINQLQPSQPSTPNYGKIKPLTIAYFYSNPQPFMFIFTLLLTISLSILMVTSVFIGLYHKIIGSILCLYVTYRFVSLGLSNPGLAVQTANQLLEKQITTNEIIPNQTSPQLSDTDNPQTQSPKQLHLCHQQSHPTRQLFSKFGFYHFCHQCKVPILRATKHCNICKTCIDGFDHHCIWIGKCIGKNNMWQFKNFLCFVFVTLIYALILSIQTSKIQRIS